MGTEQGADERRIRQLLRSRGVGPDATLPLPPPPPDDWWDRLYADRHPHPDPVPAAAPRLPDWRKGQTADLRGPDPERPDKPTRKRKTAPPDPEPVEDEETEEEDWEDVDEAEPQPASRPAPARARRKTAGARAQHEYAQVPGRIRWLIYNGIAAAGGYWLGLVPLMESWLTDCGQHNGPTAAIVLGVGLIGAVGILIDRRTRDWWGPLPELCRIPLASAVLALLLYAPGVTS